jgi:hypothetical protein
MQTFLSSPLGQAALSFLRVFAATVLASWFDAGMTLRNLSGDLIVGWVELGLAAGVALVLANYFGPWEKRYGRGKASPLSEG